MWPSGFGQFGNWTNPSGEGKGPFERLKAPKEKEFKEK
jgi:hypothetical protein